MSINICELLADFEKVNVRTRTAFANCGYLDPTFDEDLPNDAKVEMPVWMVKRLFQRGMVSLDPIPKNYSKRFFTAWLTEPEHTPLPPLYYELGVSLSQLTKNAWLDGILFGRFS
eukprot:UN00746